MPGGSQHLSEELYFNLKEGKKRNVEAGEKHWSLGLQVFVQNVGAPLNGDFYSVIPIIWNSMSVCHKSLNWRDEGRFSGHGRG